MNLQPVFKLMLLLIPYISALSPLLQKKQVTDGFGINIHFTHPKVGELEMIASAGFKWVRMDFFWESTEKQKGVYNFSDYDFLLTELTKNNISAYFILDYGNKIYPTVLTDEGRSAYARWAAASVEHFKGRGIVWEIWNEPNGDGFWFGHHDVHQYIPMALEAVKAIKAKTTNEVVMGPATSGIDFTYLEECFRSGLLDYWDAVSVHPYRQSNPETVTRDYIELKRLIAKYAPNKTIPIISGEWGYSSVWKDFNDTIQSRYLPRELLINVMNNIPISIWYDWHNDGTNKTDPEDNFGTVQFEYHSGSNPVYTPKDSYITAKTLSSSLKGYQFVKRIATNDTKDYVLLFKNGNDLRLVVWTTSSTLQNISIPSDKCDFEIIHGLGDKIEKTSAKDGKLTLTISEYPHYIIIKGPNHAIESAPDFNLYGVSVEPINGKNLFIRLFKLYETPINGTIKLTNTKGIDPTQTEIKFQMTNEFEKVITISLKSKPTNEFTIGVNVESNGNVITSNAMTYHFLTDQVLADCMITSDGNSSVKSVQSVSVHSAPEPLSDSNSTVLKIDYEFFGTGWKFLNVFPKSSENRKISGEPKALGVWIYGDNQGMTIKMRISDASHQVFQIVSENSQRINWKGWKYVVFNQFESHWGGSNDGKVHFPEEYAALLLIDNQRQSNTNSTIFITSPIAIY